MIKDALLAAGSARGHLSTDGASVEAPIVAGSLNNMRGAWLLQTAQELRNCITLEECQADRLQLTLVLLVLLSAIFSMLCAFAFFREDKEDITPLTPQLMVKETEMRVNLPLSSHDDNFSITKQDGEFVANVTVEWPDPFRPGCGVAGQIRVYNSQQVLGIVSARHVMNMNSFWQVPHGLALCREKHEMFAWVEVEGPTTFHVRHRTGQPLLTLTGELNPGGTMDMEGYNLVGSKVCWLKDGKCAVVQHFDAGMVFLSFLAIYLHKRLQALPAADHDQPASGRAETKDEPIADVPVAAPEEEVPVSASPEPRS
eukprot:TRINITY_DN62907_c0_g1_i1.p1 TRINITY_DN62907_c0_g1~~TRINITY_DN62907_c0_g1_i1.p1  ORF type:complete len:313 (+),score=63.10 TRINITY_DN62907_c0_g1_i1:103-1041(+)